MNRSAQLGLFRRINSVSCGAFRNHTRNRYRPSQWLSAHPFRQHKISGWSATAVPPADKVLELLTLEDC
jgi:hypothetical protein